MSEKTRPCEICGQPIDPQRAAEDKKTRLCEEHQKQIGKYGGEFILTGSHDSTGKPGSLKTITSGVTVKARRNQEAIDKLKDDYDKEQWEKKKKSGG